MWVLWVFRVVQCLLFIGAFLFGSYLLLPSLNFLQYKKDAPLK